MKNAPSTKKILSQLKSDYIAIENGTLVTRPIEELFEELNDITAYDRAKENQGESVDFEEVCKELNI